MEEFKIYNPTGELILSTFVDDASYRLREVMGSNSLELRFSLNRFVPIIEGSYCNFREELYWMPRSLDYVKEHSENFAYTLNMEGSLNFLKSTKFKFFDYLLEAGLVKPTSSFKLKFPITATPRMIAQLIVANLKLKYPQYPWAIGECIESEPVTIDFNHDFCYDALPKVVDAFTTEWEVDKYTIHFRKVERLDDNGNKISFKLSYGYNNGILGGIRRIQYDNTKIINRVYIEGSERNIDRSTYGRDRNPSGNDTLLLPSSKLITYEGIEYTTDESGSYLERVVPLAGEEDSLDVSKFYPKRVGAVSEVEMINDKEGFYNIIDEDIPADLDFSKMIIAGETMTVIFQTGQLAGKEFDVKYIHAKRKFELVPIDQNGLIYPQGHIIPVVGDTYAVFHMRLPENYITDAETEALQEVAKYLWEGEQSQYSYRWSLDAIHARRNWGEIRGYLNIGYFVEFSDPQFLPEPVDVRIVAVKEPANDPQSPEITIANKVSGKTFGAVINEIPAVEQAVDRKDKEVVSYVKRGFKQSNETMKKLIESMLDFDGAIKPIAVQTMMMLVGDESLQFRYVDQRNNPAQIPSGIVYNAIDKRLICPVGIMQHMTLGITSLSSSHTPDEYKFWDAKAYQSDVLTDQNKSYFLYLKCSRTDYSDGVYLISEDGIKMESMAGYYHFLVGILNSEDEDGNRSFTEMYGLTEILPGRITTDKVVSGDGAIYIDLLNNIFSMVENGVGIDWNVIKNTLRLINATLEIKNMQNETLAKIDGKTGAAMFGKGTNVFDELGNVSLSNGAHKFSANGNFDMAKSNFTYDNLLNLLTMRGKFESNADGNRIIIDPEDRRIKMIGASNREILSIYFIDREGGYASGTVTSRTYNRNGGVSSETSMNGSEIHLWLADSRITYSLSASGLRITDNSKSRFHLQWNPDKEILYMGGELPRSPAGSQGRPPSDISTGEWYTATIDGKNVICVK